MASSHTHIPRLSALLVAITATFLLTVFLDHYKESGVELLTDHTFSNGLTNWRSKTSAAGSLGVAEGGTLHLNAANTGNYTAVWQDIKTPPAHGFLRLSASIKIADVIQGPRGWHKARLILDRRDSSGNSQKLPHHTASLDGTSDWERYEQVFRMVPDTSGMSVKAELAKASGNMWIRDLSLKQVIVSPLFSWLKPTVFIAWAILLFWMLHPYFTGKSGLVLSTATILIVAAILVGTLAPAVSKTRFQGAAKEMTTTLLASHLNLSDNALHEPGDEHPYDFYIKRVEIGKIGHFLLFVIFSFLILTCGKTFPRSTVMIDSIILAAITELLQFFTEGRSPMLYDFGIDLGGILTGLLFYHMLAKLKNKPSSRIDIPANI